jgi:hypothetical protein
MSVWDIVYLVLVAVCVLIALISTIIAVRKRKATAVTDETSVVTVDNSPNFFEEFANKAIELINSVEGMYSKFNIKKAGELKLDTVLTKLRTYITDRGQTFDESKWRTFVENIVSTGNNIGHGTTTEVPSQSTGNDVVSVKSNIDNVRI